MFYVSIMVNRFLKTEVDTPNIRKKGMKVYYYIKPLNHKGKQQDKERNK